MVSRPCLQTPQMRGIGMAHDERIRLGRERRSSEEADECGRHGSGVTSRDPRGVISHPDPSGFVSACGTVLNS
jgi:hypothetical protein